MTPQITIGAAALTASLAGAVQIARAWPGPTDQHRKPNTPVVKQRFVHCPTCEVETAATVHGAVVLCAEGHQQPVGGAA